MRRNDAVEAQSRSERDRGTPYDVISHAGRQESFSPSARKPLNPAPGGLVSASPGTRGIPSARPRRRYSELFQKSTSKGRERARSHHLVQIRRDGEGPPVAPETAPPLFQPSPSFCTPAPTSSRGTDKRLA